MAQGKPHLVFGAGGIGSTKEDGAVNFTYKFHDADTTNELLSALKELGINEIDSAASYPPGNLWDAERLLGESEAAKKGFVIDSKVLLSMENGKLVETLREAGIRDSLHKTLGLTKAQKVRTYYAHTPQPMIPLAETAAGFDKVYREGKIERLGLCNYSFEEMKEYFEICEKNGFVKPTVYQGQYNALKRDIETDLLPLLKKHNCVYYAFSPLAGGFLTGKVTMAQNKPDDDTLKRTRWNEKGGLAPYQTRYLHQEYHDAINSLKAKCEAANPPISLQEAAFRWIMHHSALGEGDAIIAGASRIDQLKGNVADCRKGPLPDEVLEEVESMYEKVKHVGTGSF